MDKSWMSKNRISDEYEVGVDAFLKFAVERGCDANLMSCPCAKCGNTRKHKLSLVKGHIIMNGMDMTYQQWIWHGEGLKSSQSTCDRNFGKGDTSYCVDEPIAMIHDAYDAYEDNPTHFQTLLEDAEQPLYEDCSRFTKLLATIKMYNLKAKYGWSDTSFKDLLKLIKEMLPEGNLMPASLYAAKKTLSTLGLDYKKIHACPNDCILYRKEFKDSNDCPTCGMSRWKTNTKSKSVSRVPSKVLWYFPPIPRFRRMFRTPEISKELTWHSDERTQDGTLRHPADAPAWKLVDNKWPDFGHEMKLHILLEPDVIPFCKMDPITGNCIVAYVWHLYTNMNENDSLCKFLFVNPFTVEYGLKDEDRSRALSERLLLAASDQLVLVPCNVGGHWILTIFQVEKNQVFLMDPLCHRNKDTIWKSVVDTALSIVHANKGKKSRKPTWEVIKGPMQPDSKQCGYYVMRFMRDIITGFENAAASTFQLSSLFKGVSTYSQAQLDEVREEWAKCVIKHVFD